MESHFPVPGPGENSTSKAGKSLNFVPPTLLQHLLGKDILSNFDFWKSFPPYIFR